MLTPGGSKAPDIAFIADDVTNRLTVTKVSATNVPHTDFWPVLEDTLNMDASWHQDMDTYIQAGDYI